MQREVVFGPDGEIINIGPWDYQITKVETGEIGEDGEAVLVDQVGNPLPEGAVSGMAEVVQGPDGGWYRADDPRAAG